MNFANPANLLIAGIYFVIVLVLTFFSLFGVYILLKYGRSRALSFTVSVVYTVFYLTFLTQSYGVLQSLN